MLVLTESIFCFGSLLAMLYAIHARRKAPERWFALIGLTLASVVFALFAMVMIVAGLELGHTLCR